MDRHRPIAGIGTDIVSVGRLKRSIQKNGPDFLRMIYTDHEIDYCKSRRNAYELYAAMFAAKEAVVKALGMGFIGEIQWTDVEVYLGKRVFIETKGAVQRIMKKRGIGEILSNCATTHEFCVANIILVTKEE